MATTVTKTDDNNALSVTVEVDRDLFTEKLRRLGLRRVRRSLRNALKIAADALIKEASFGAELE